MATKLGIVLERVTRLYTAVIKDEEGAVIPAAQIGTLTLTLYNKKTGAIVNSRTDVNILNANGGTVDASGNLSFLFTPADMAIIDTTLASEIRIGLFEWTYGGGAKEGRHEIEFSVRNLNKVPT